MGMKSSNLLMLLSFTFILNLQAQQKLYWTDNSIGLMSANIDGTNSKVLIKNRILELSSIDIDTINDKVYWTDNVKKHIGRSNIDGSNVEILIEFTTATPSNIRVDNINNKIYWFELANKTLNRATLNGSLREVVASNLPAGYGSFELDIRNGKVFWLDGTNSKIIKANLDNTAQTDVVTALPNVYLTNLKLDLMNQRVYWANIEFTDSVKTTIKTRTFEGLDEKTIFSKKYTIAYVTAWEFEINPVQNTLYIRDIYEPLVNGSYVAGGFLIGKMDGTNLNAPFGWLQTFRYGRFRADLKNNKLYAIGAAPHGIYSFSFTNTGFSQRYITKETIISPSGIAVDKTGGKMYWTDQKNSKIQKSNLDGTVVEDVLSGSNGLLEPLGLALDLVNRQMFWTDRSKNAIQSANLDGTNVKTVVDLNLSTIGAVLPGGIALDVPNKKLYFTAQGVTGIYNANFDGTNLKNVFRYINRRYFGDQFALDLENNKMYWSEGGDVNGIVRANLDGTQRDTFFRKAHRQDGGISLDITNKKVYWIADSILQRVNFDGTNPVNLITNLTTLQYGFGGYMTYGASHSYVNGEIASKVNDLAQLLDVKVFPTVFDKSISIEIKDNDVLPVQYTFYDITGRVIKNGFLNQNHTIGDLDSLDTGIYILELKTRDKYFSTKLVKSKS